MEVHDTGAAVVHHVVPGAEDGAVGGLFPSLDHIGVGSKAVGVEVPHAVVVALETSALEAVDAGIEVGNVGHAAVDIVTAVVVDLSFDITDDGMYAPDVGVLTTLAAAVDAGSVCFCDTAKAHGELGGVVGEQEVAAVGSKSLQGADNLGGCQVAGQVLEATFDADAVAHHPTHRVLLDVELVDGGGGEDNALAGSLVGLLEPSHSVFLIIAGRVVFGHEHSYLLLGRCSHILQAVGSEAFQLVLLLVGAVDIPLVGGETHGENPTGEGGGGMEVHDTGAAVVHHVVPGAEDGAVGGLFPSLDHIGVGSKAVGVEVPHAVVVALETSALEAVDAGIEVGNVGHAAVDIVTAVVVDLSFDITDDGMYAPDVGVLTTLAVAVDTGSVCFCDTAEAHGELGGVVGEQEVTAIGSKGFQGFDGRTRCEVTGQVLPTLLDADAVTDHPNGGLLFDVEFVDVGGSEEHTLASGHVVLLEPGDGIFLVG